MKISKVNHHKSAVSLNENDIKGILYVDPHISKNTELEKYIAERISASQNLFSLFKNVKNKDIKKMCSKIDKTIKNKNGNVTASDLININVKKNDADGSEENIENLKKNIRKCVNVNTRDFIARDKRLKKALEKLLLNMRNIEKIDNGDEDIKRLALAINKAYLKDASGIKKSIENQNLSVQLSKDNEHFEVYPVTNLQNTNSVKKNEKEAFKHFMSDYARIDKHKRDELLLKLRRLNVLYFYGYDEAKNSLKYPEDIFADHEKRKCDKVKFVDKNILNEELLRLHNASIESIEKDNSLFFDDINLNRFWIRFIGNYTQKQFKKFLDSEDDFKKNRGYICEKAWKEILCFLSGKYIAEGKMVYQFAMDKIASNESEYDFGIIPERYKDGIKSFDFEMISANESIKRDIAVSVTFAVNNIARSVIDDKKAKNNYDLLSIDDEKLVSIMYDNEALKRNIYQFWGGMSKWKSFEDNNVFCSTKDYYHNLVIDIRNILANVRNENFHFKTSRYNAKKIDIDRLSKIFEFEANNASKVYRDKFYSNNLWEFYSDADMENALNILYSSYNYKASQIPAFGNVISRGKLNDFLVNDIKMTINYRDSETTERCRNAIYYLLKEVYYRGFLASNDVYEYFVNAIKKVEDEKKNFNFKDKQFQSIDDYVKRINELENNINTSNGKDKIAKICQFIMTENNQQNAGRKKVDTSKTKKNNKRIFEHYKMLLYKTLKYAYLDYLNKSAFAFIKNPKNDQMRRKDIAGTEFLPNWNAKTYISLVEKFKTENELQKMYIVAKLLPPRQLNRLIGEFKNYKSYTEDIERRANSNANILLVNKLYTDAVYNDIIQVLEMCMVQSGVITNKINDYFKDENAYSDYLRRYIDKDIENFELYKDGKNFILNRNVVLSKIYGAHEVLENTIEKISQKDIEDYKNALINVEEFRKTGKCESSEEQKNVNIYQRIKNRVTLANVLTYSEIINSLLGQLVGWSFLRERDLMYFQLGFHYECLQNDEEKMPTYNMIEVMQSDNTVLKINNAILYQIAAMYINGMPIYACDNNKEFSTVSTGLKIKMFCEYTLNAFNDKSRKEDYYNAGLEIFEDVKEHDNIANLRNHIDHFKYYSIRKDMPNEYAKSLLDLYSETFDRFFTYDNKLRKSVPVVFENILRRYFVILSLKFDTAKKNIGKNNEKDMAHFTVTPRSDSFTYKFKEKNPNDKDNNDNVRDEQFLVNIAKILYYPNEVPQDVLENINKKDNNKNNKKNNKNKTKSKDFTYKPFKDIKL